MQPTFAETSAPGLARLVAGAVAAAFRVEIDDLFAPTRRRRRIARARQIAMYLSHAGLGFSLSRASRCFARDRATVRHACALIEDARDDHRFDQMMFFLEQALLSHASLCAEFAAAR